MNEVVADGVNALAFGTQPLLFGAPSGANENGARAHRVSEIDVEPLVADHPRLRRIDLQLSRGIFDHPRQRLAAAAVNREVGNRSARMMVAEIQRIEIGVGRLQAPPHLGVAFRDELGRDQAVRDSRLIRDHDEQIAGPLEQPQRVAGLGEQLEIFETMQVADVDIQRPVTIEKDCFFQALKPSRPHALTP